MNVEQKLNVKKKNFKKFPIQLFFFFNKSTIFFWTSKTLKKNHYLCYLPNETLLSLASILKHELYLNNSQLIEASAIDLTNQKDFKKLFFLKKENLIIYYSFYFFYIKQRITFFFKKNKKINSIDFYFSNANWLEREFSEMYGIFFKNKKDIRNLILDYGILENPMLKQYPTSGFEEIYFDPIEKNVKYVSNSHVNL